ncbi:MAG: hypothetical protein KDJ54_19540 [Candidatus Competibacteraceae bacterium]|nr:hypothetical protein [Candidatus Competibacteraceae bacterium]
MADQFHPQPQPRAHAADPAHAAAVRQRHRADAIARIKARIEAGDLDDLPDVFLIVAECAMNRDMSQIGRFARCAGYLFVSPQPGVLTNA